jgi:SPP1 gp7 family putative phage head morphogenesis protein
MDIRTKLNASDVDGYDWNWEEKYAKELAEEMAETFTTAFVLEVPNLPGETVQQIAARWAEQRAATMITGVANTTKEGVRKIIAAGVESGEGIRAISRKIEKSYDFSKDKATLIARTETATALGGGQKEAAIAQGRDEKRWLTIGDVDDECLDNESQGWIGISDPFTSGVDTVPAHPNCRCVVSYRTKELHALMVSLTGHLTKSDFRCPDCNKLLARDAYDGTRIMCRHCKKEQMK